MGLYKNLYFDIYYFCLSKNICLDMTSESVSVHATMPSYTNLQVILS